MNAAIVNAEGLTARIQALEGAIARNREEKQGAPDCPCWANAPQMLDAELYRALSGPAGEPAMDRVERLKAAIQKHREEKALTPECTCWVTPSARADAKLYALLEES